MKMQWVHHSEPGYDAATRFLSRRIWGRNEALNDGTALAVIDGRELRAVALFNNFDPDAGVIELHLAGDGRRWLTRPVMFEMFSFPFDQLKCRTVVTRTAPENTPALRLNARYGFNLVEVPDLRGRRGAEIIGTLTDEEWRRNGYHKEHKNG